MTSTLTFQEAQLFYTLWMSLLNYVNQTYQLNPCLGKLEKAEDLSNPNVRIVSDYLWNHSSIIDTYLSATELSPEHREIVAGWKNFIKNQFILERHLQKGSVLLSLNDNAVYIVNTIDSNFEKKFADMSLPLLLEATLIPFNGKIIYYDITVFKNIPLGIGYIDAFKEIYMTSKKEKSFQTTL